MAGRGGIAVFAVWPNECFNATAVWNVSVKGQRHVSLQRQEKCTAWQCFALRFLKKIICVSQVWWESRRYITDQIINIAWNLLGDCAYSQYYWTARIASFLHLWQHVEVASHSMCRHKCPGTINLYLLHQFLTNAIFSCSLVGSNARSLLSFGLLNYRFLSLLCHQPGPELRSPFPYQLA